jgi:hypothetical protein
VRAHRRRALRGLRRFFDLKPDDLFWCTADIGWVTGHSYVVYGPLCNGATLMMYEGAPDWPDRDRFWAIVEEYGVTILYTAPTAIRTFMKWGTEPVERHNLSSLRLLGTVGEPINPEAWIWYYENIGRKRCPIVDTWWQTETGHIMVTTLPGIDPMRPGFAGKAAKAMCVTTWSVQDAPSSIDTFTPSLTDPHVTNPPSNGWTAQPSNRRWRPSPSSPRHRTNGQRFSHHSAKSPRSGGRQSAWVSPCPRQAKAASRAGERCMTAPCASSHHAPATDSSNVAFDGGGGATRGQ